MVLGWRGVVVTNAIQRRVRFSAADDEFSVRGVLFDDFPEVVDGYSRSYGTPVSVEIVDISDIDSFVDEHDLLRSEQEFCGQGGVLVRHRRVGCHSSVARVLSQNGRMDSTQ